MIKPSLRYPMIWNFSQVLSCRTIYVAHTHASGNKKLSRPLEQKLRAGHRVFSPLIYALELRMRGSGPRNGMEGGALGIGPFQTAWMGADGHSNHGVPDVFLADQRSRSVCYNSTGELYA